LHENGLVHRDIKPSNIIFVGGVPKLADIGLVADLDEAKSFVGTPGYIPPEGPGKPQADLYSLGKVLYEMSTGRDRQDFPQLPANLRELPDAALLVEFNEVLLDACESEVQKRYQSADEMRDDLGLLQLGRSVKKRHAHQRMWTHTRRAGFGLAILATVVAVTFVVHLWQPPTSQEARKRSTNSDANTLYDLGRNAYVKNTESGVAQAALYFQRAINVDTNFTLAQAALAASWCWPISDPSDNFRLLPRAKDIAESALAKDESLSEAHLAVGCYAFVKDWNFPKAEHHFQVAIRNDPQNPQPYEWYGQFLSSVGRTNEGVKQLRKAVELNPRSVTGNRFLGRGLLASRQYTAAIATSKKAWDLESKPTDLYWLGKALEADGQIQEAITAMERWGVLTGDPPGTAGTRAAELRHALEIGGAPCYYQKLYEILKRENAPRTEMAEASAIVGKNDEALDLLEQAFQLHDWKLLLLADLKTRAAWDGLRNTRRFRALLKDMNLE
jgi:serine/threonine protein kinase